MTCPFCQSEAFAKLYPDHQGECITSDIRFVQASRIENRLCTDCGFIFNHAGPRGHTEEFYAKTYQLRMHSTKAQNINFSGQSAVPMAKAVADFLVSQAALGENGRILEAGAGKGEFLIQFMGLRPDWSPVAFEPSQACSQLTERVPSAKVFHGGYQDVEINEQFDVVASLAVIEHVELPFEFMCWLRGRVSDTGHLLLTFPDFSRNPNDMFCVDHLSKISMPQLLMMAARAGLELVASRHVGIALLALFRKGTPASGFVPVTGQAREIAARNEALASSMVAAVGAARGSAKAAGENFAVFGLGMSGLVAPVLLGFPRSDIAAYVDENPTMHGLTIGSSPVVDLPMVASLKLRHVALSTSPIYREQITAKLEPYGVHVYA